jgi:hypothetical protein
MKNLLITIATVIFTASAFAATPAAAPAEIIDPAMDAQSQILSALQSVKIAVSNASGLRAQAIDLLTGEGINPHSIVLSLIDFNAGGNVSVFNLLNKIETVRRVTFSAVNEITINYMQTNFDNGQNLIKENKTIVVKVLRGANQELRLAVVKK